MTELLVFKYLHLLAFVYWLGGDLGTFFASNQVIRRDISPEARSIALKIMLACDMGPKLAMPLIVALGFQLSVSMGYLEIPALGMVLVWALTMLWLANVAIIHFKEGTPLAHRTARFDLLFRIAVFLVLGGYASWGLVTGQIAAPWVGWKILIFAALVLCGIAIRLRLRPFGPAFAKLVTDGPDDRTNKDIEQTIYRCRPFVWAIWIGLFVNAAIGIHLI